MQSAGRGILIAAKLLGLTVLALALLGAGTAIAKPSKYDFHAGDGFADIQSPDVARASNGDTITLSATGSFHVSSRKASGGGTFEHRSSGGTLLATGTFSVLGLTSFESFGCGVFEGQPLPPNFCGGRAVLPVHVIGHPVSGGTKEFNAIFTITCVVGDQVPAGTEENDTFEHPGINFDERVSGENLFVKK
jgi:hypothetical protein